MDIIFKGEHNGEEAAESLVSIIELFKTRYGISNFREMSLQVTLVNDKQEDVELVDANTSDVLGLFEVYKSYDEPIGAVSASQKNKQSLLDKALTEKPYIKLVVDNTRR